MADSAHDAHQRNKERVAELKSKIAQITTSEQYKMLCSSHRDAPKQRAMDNLNLQLAGLRAQLQASEIAPETAPRRSPGAVAVSRPTVYARQACATIETAPDVPKPVTQVRATAVAQSRRERLQLASALPVREPEPPAPEPVSAAPVRVPQPEYTSNVSKNYALPQSRRARGAPSGPIITIISEPGQAVPRDRAVQPDSVEVDGGDDSALLDAVFGASAASPADEIDFLNA